MLLVFVIHVVSICNTYCQYWLYMLLSVLIIKVVSIYNMHLNFHCEKSNLGGNTDISLNPFDFSSFPRTGPIFASMLHL